MREAAKTKVKGINEMRIYSFHKSKVDENQKEKRHESREMLIESESKLEAREFSLTSAALSHLSNTKQRMNVEKQSQFHWDQVTLRRRLLSPPSYSYSLKFFFHFDQQCMNILTHLNCRCCCHIPTRLLMSESKDNGGYGCKNMLGPWRRLTTTKADEDKRCLLRCVGGESSRQIRNVQKKGETLKMKFTGRSNLWFSININARESSVSRSPYATRLHALHVCVC